MCGIAGIIHFNNKPVLTEQLKQMTDVIAHRGPDGEGYWVNAKSNVGFGHRRLSIIDLSSNGKQPMHYANNRYTVTFNGEIYNYIELREQLISKGYLFHSNSDTEVLLALYDLKKEKCLADLDGMFAFAIWDEKEQELFCARDRFGEKPFYYSYEKGQYFYFASEMKELWAIGISKQNDSDVLNNFLKTEKVVYSTDTTKTFYKNVKQLDSSHYLIIKKNADVKIERYYDLDNIQINRNISLSEAVEKFTQLFTESVRLRLRSDVAVGSSLSGGLDSSSIVMMMDKLKGEATQQKTFSARFKSFDKDEGVHIHKVVDACKNVVCYEVWPKQEELQKILPELIFHQEEPFASSSVFAQWKVMELAKQNGTVVLLDGQGADEYLAGYLPLYGLYLKQLFFTDKGKYNHEQSIYLKLRGSLGCTLEEDETIRMKIGRLKKKIFKQAMPYNNESLTRELKKQMLSIGLKELLRYADRNSMAHSREVRLPFLSHKLIDFVFSLPDEFKLFEGWTKYILRLSMNDLLPKDIAWRVDKIGYVTPQNNWMENNYWKNQIEEGKNKFSELTSTKNGKMESWNYIMLNNFFYR
ncbi:MAG: asparagine synthase (glutamine-hydrolyzing) [Bacteroidia bacterium]|nr:asparagine synthase (glutamine-hydrolyzing) [Bacteroidia bacterium]